MMIRKMLLSSTVLLAISGQVALAENFSDMLARAYEVNPGLRANYIAISEANEAVPTANALIKPSFDANISLGIEGSDVEQGGISQDGAGHSASAALIATQPLYTFGRYDAALGQALAASDTAILGFQAKIQQTLSTAAKAYLDVIESSEEVKLNENNVNVLKSQLKATQDRFDVGELTRTDVALAESALAGSESELEGARAKLAAASAAYEEVSGAQPGTVSLPESFSFLPTSLIAAQDIAKTQALEIKLSDMALKSVEDEIASKKAADNPIVNLNGNASLSDKDVLSSTKTHGFSVTAQLSVPLYNGGARESDVRKAMSKKVRLQREREQTLREVASNVSSTWARLESARKTIVSSKAAVRAARLAMQGTREEFNVGERTLVDVLDAEQKFLNASVQLVRAEVGWYKAQVELALVVGSLDEDNLNLKVSKYDVTALRPKPSGLWQLMK